MYPARVETGASAIVPLVRKLPGLTAEPDCVSKITVLEFAVHFA